MERLRETQTQLVLKTIPLRRIRSGTRFRIRADHCHQVVIVDPAMAEKAEQLVFDDPPNHIRSQSSPSATSHDRPSILPRFNSAAEVGPAPPY
jgi:hypothetical protein